MFTKHKSAEDLETTLATPQLYLCHEANYSDMPGPVTPVYAYVCMYMCMCDVCVCVCTHVNVPLHM